MKINKVSIVALRNSQNWTQEDLAAAAGLSVRTIQRVETMGTGSQDTSKALAAAFNVDIAKVTTPEEDWAWIWFTYKVLMKTVWPIVLTAFALTMLGGLLIEKEVIQETTAAYYAGSMVTLCLIIWKDAALKVYEAKYGAVDWSRIKWL